VAVRGQHRILDDVAHDLAARQLGWRRPLPLRQQLARAVSSPASSASRMAVKWWLNWRKPSVT
jgi:hypothetical protein